MIFPEIKQSSTLFPCVISVCVISGARTFYRGHAEWIHPRHGRQLFPEGAARTRLRPGSPEKGSSQSSTRKHQLLCQKQSIPRNNAVKHAGLSKFKSAGVETIRPGAQHPQHPRCNKCFTNFSFYHISWRYNISPMKTLLDQ